MNLSEKYINLYLGENILSDANKLKYNEVNLEFTRTEKMILFLLKKNEKKTMGQLASTFDIPNSTTNFIIKKLKKKGLVKTKKNIEDMRIIEVYITEKGEDILEKILENIDQRLMKVLEKIEVILSNKMTLEDIKVIKKAINLLK